MRAQRCKGTCDLLPGDMRRFRLIEGSFRENCLKWGYEEVKTPTLEYLHLFTSTGTLTPGRLRNVYSFLDWDGWSGERVVLRPDGTIPIARLYIESTNQGQLAKLFYVTNVFSFEETGKESREKWQCGAELIGAGSTTADAELVALAVAVLRGVRLKDISVRLSHAGLIRAVLVRLGLSQAEQSRLFDEMLDGDGAALRKINAEMPDAGRALASLLEMKGRSSGFLKNIRALFGPDLAELGPHCDSFIGVAELLETLGISYQVDLAAGRGFEYYTGVIFQLLCGDEIVGGGGRYDALIPLMGGGDIPASGFALYMGRLMERIETPPPTSCEWGVLVRPAGSSPCAVRQAFDLAGWLRERGYTAPVHLGGPEPDTRWFLDAGDSSSLLVLTDREKQTRIEVQSRDELLALLGDRGAGQDCLA